jgi:hypothetical protein
MTKLQLYLSLIGAVIVAVAGGAWALHHAGYTSGYADAIASVKREPQVKLMSPPAVIDTGEISAHRIASDSVRLTVAQARAFKARLDSLRAAMPQSVESGSQTGPDSSFNAVVTVPVYHIDKVFDHHYETPLDTTVTDSLSFDFVLAPSAGVKNFRFVPAPVPVRTDTVVIVQTVSGGVSFGEAAKYVLVGIGVGAIIEGVIRK